MFSKMGREIKTIEYMIRIYCQGRHQSMAELCPECGGLLSYAIQRIRHCPLKEEKTTCAQCPVHCYKPAMREKIRDVMRYAGPRMTYKHPVLTLFHLMDGLKPGFIKHVTKRKKNKEGVRWSSE